MNKKCVCKLDSINWVELLGFNGVCDNCGNPHKYESIVGKYNRNAIHHNRLWHVYTLRSQLVCLGCDNISIEIRISCKNDQDNFSALFEKVNTPIEVRRDN